MEVETLGIARNLAWKVHMRCSDGYREGTKSMRRCIYRRQLDIDTLVCTRGPNFPLSRLEFAPHVSGLREPKRYRRVRTAGQSRGASRMTWEGSPSNHLRKAKGLLRSTRKWHAGRTTRSVWVAARNIHRSSRSLPDVQLLAGRSSIETEERYIDGDTSAQRRLLGQV